MNIIKELLEAINKIKLDDLKIKDSNSLGKNTTNNEHNPTYDNNINSIINDFKKMDKKNLYNPIELSKSKLKLEKCLANELNNYQKAYVLPNILFTETEWIELFNILYDYYYSLGRQEDTYKLLSYLQKRTLASSLVTGQNSISIENYLDNLQFINMENEDILEVRETLIKKIGGPKIVDIKSYAKRKEKKKQTR